MTPLIEVKGLVKSFRQGEAKLDVLKGIDLAVARGECVSLVGPSGAGKSPFLHILGALDRSLQTEHGGVR